MSLADVHVAAHMAIENSYIEDNVSRRVDVSPDCRAVSVEACRTWLNSDAAGDCRAQGQAEASGTGYNDIRVDKPS